MNDSTSRVAVVTGGGRGLGRAVANRLAALGHHVVVTDVDLAGAKETAAALPSATALVHDVRDPAAHWSVAERAAGIGPLTVWVNNAGALVTGAPWLLDDETVSRIVDVNLLGVIHGCRAAVATMSKGDGGGDIVNIASLAAFGPVPGVGVYAATKAAVTSFTTSLAGDLRWAGLHDRIRVHALCPGASDTAMVREVADDPTSALLHAAPRLIPPPVVADAVVRMIGTRSVVRTMPRGRAAMLRAASLAPGTSVRLLLPYFRSVGERRRTRMLGAGQDVRREQGGGLP
jgi:NAD(P)-dependent dehydrogenase (short-subunit alcohol dehydrogenase family)